MTNEQEKQWREEFYAAFPRHAGVIEMYMAGSLGHLESMTAIHQFNVWKTAKQSSQALIDAKDRDLEAEREKVMILRDASRQALYLLRNGKSGLEEAMDILKEAISATESAEEKE